MPTLPGSRRGDCRVGIVSTGSCPLANPARLAGELARRCPSLIKTIGHAAAFVGQQQLEAGRQISVLTFLQSAVTRAACWILVYVSPSANSKRPAATMRTFPDSSCQISRPTEIIKMRKPSQIETKSALKQFLSPVAGSSFFHRGSPANALSRRRFNPP